MDKDHLAACHCEKEHDELFLIEKNGNMTSFRNNPELKKRIRYANIDCADEILPWKTITDNSINFVWSIGCPLNLINDEKPVDLVFNALIDILNNSWRVLKSGGKLMIPIRSERSNEYMNRLKNFNQTYGGNNPWNFEIIPQSNLEFTVNRKNPIILGSYVVLTKPVAGGRRRKTRRVKRKITKRRKH